VRSALSTCRPGDEGNLPVKCAHSTRTTFRVLADSDCAAGAAPPHYDVNRHGVTPWTASRPGVPRPVGVGHGRCCIGPGGGAAGGKPIDRSIAPYRLGLAWRTVKCFIGYQLTVHGTHELRD
jgi:hypothetical protein